MNRLSVFIAIFVTVSVAVLFLFRSHTAFSLISARTVSPIPEESILEQFLPFLSLKKSPDELKKKITEAADNSLVNYSVTVKDLTSDFRMDINEAEIYSAASVNKLPIIAVLYALAHKGDINLDTVITLQPDDIQDYGTGSIRYENPGVTYSIKTLARLMVQKSDNTAAYILARQVIGMDTIQNMIAGWGMSQTDMENNRTSNTDIDLLMEKIYREKITDHAQTLELLSFLKDTEIEDRIPALLPKDVTVYHKTGNGVGFVHDVGIVTGPKARYYVGILTRDVQDEQLAVRQIARISKIIYDFMR